MRSASSSTSTSTEAKETLLLLDVVEQAAGRGDDDLAAFAQLGDLRLDVHAAVDADRAQRHMLAVGDHALMHLHGQFAGRRQDQRAYRVARRRGRRRGVPGQALQQRQGEAGGLAGAGLRPAHDVLAGHDDGDGLGLDRRRVGVARVLYRTQQLRQQAEVVEAYAGRLGSRRRRYGGCVDGNGGRDACVVVVQWNS
jgi:hypothetical protein